METTSPVMSITDEQIAEIEQEALRKYREPLEWFVYEPSYVLALISRMRAAERDAGRYRWLRDDRGYFPEEEGLRGGDELDAAIDTAMKGDQQ